MEKISEGLIYDGTFNKSTLFMRGKRSDYILNDDLKTIEQFFPGATVVNMDTGHLIQAEKPIEFVEVVLNFLKST
jgi:pimeloyl-ACP methyl ester carboxylesterase